MPSVIRLTALFVFLVAVAGVTMLTLAAPTSAAGTYARVHAAVVPVNTFGISSPADLTWG